MDESKRHMLRRRTHGVSFACLAALIAALALGAAPASASSVGAEGSFVQIQGDNDSDRITVSLSGGIITISDTGAGGITNGDTDCTQVNPTTVTCPLDDGSNQTTKAILVQLLSGPDSFTNVNYKTTFGQIVGIGTGVKTINGGPGGQFIIGGSDSDVLNGGDGDDQLNDGSIESEGTAGNDLLAGGAGADTALYFRDAASPLNISLDSVANDGQAGETDNVQTENVVGGPGSDTLVGDGAGNELTGLGGGDTLRGMGGNDTLFGDASPGLGGLGALRRSSSAPRGGGASATGDDTLDGGGGRDLLDCGLGFDLVLREPLDDAKPNCERTGAEVVGDSSPVGGKKKNRFKVSLACPATESEACTGSLTARAAGKKVGKGTFSVGAGKTKGAKAKLTKKGAKALRRAGGSLLVTVEAVTSEPGGTSIDSGRILIYD